MDASESPPPVVRAAGVSRARVLDVRPLLARGGEPFQEIMDAVQACADDEALHLVAPFEPRPLFGIMRTLGRSTHVEREGPTVHVWFYREGGASAAPAGGGRVPLKAPVMLEVSGLGRGEPTIAILEKLADLGPGAQLVVRAPRELALVQEKLALRGYAARAEAHGEGYLIHVRPAWAFDD
jgi:hypothetical protein